MSEPPEDPRPSLAEVVARATNRSDTDPTWRTDYTAPEDPAETCARLGHRWRDDHMADLVCIRCGAALDDVGGVYEDVDLPPFPPD